MKFFVNSNKEKDKSQIIYNNYITISNIPLEVYNYVINGRSALEWVMYNYKYDVDKNTNIINDPNDWCKEHNNEKYIFNLVLSIIEVSLQTLEILKDTPKIDFENL